MRNKKYTRFWRMRKQCIPGRLSQRLGIEAECGCSRVLIKIITLQEFKPIGSWIFSLCLFIQGWKQSHFCLILGLGTFEALWMQRWSAFMERVWEYLRNKQNQSHLMRKPFSGQKGSLVRTTPRYSQTHCVFARCSIMSIVTLNFVTLNCSQFTKKVDENAHMTCIHAYKCYKMIRRWYELSKT